MRQIPGFLNYFATPDGRVFSRRRRVLRELKQQKGSKGGLYRYVGLGRAVRLGVHQIVARTFLPPPISIDGVLQTLVRHIDNNPTNN